MKVGFGQGKEGGYEYLLVCKPLDKKARPDMQYNFPIHLKMNLQNYYHKKDGVEYMGFLWELDAEYYFLYYFFCHNTLSMYFYCFFTVPYNV